MVAAKGVASVNLWLETLDFELYTSRDAPDWPPRLFRIVNIHFLIAHAGYGFPSMAFHAERWPAGGRCDTTFPAKREST